jgi:hypothetical protein
MRWKFRCLISVGVWADCRDVKGCNVTGFHGLDVNGCVIYSRKINNVKHRMS